MTDFDNFLPLDIDALQAKTGNIYKAISLIGKRSNQLTVQLKEEIQRRISEFAPAHDNLEEIIENKEQIEISKAFERRPKPLQVAMDQFMHDEVYYRNINDSADTNAADVI